MGIMAYIVMVLAVCNAILQILPLDNESWNCFLEGLIMVFTFILELCEKRNQIPWGLYSTKKAFDAYEAGCSFTKLQLLLWFEHETPDVMHFFLENLSRQIVAFCMIRIIFILICLNWEKWPDSELGEHHETQDPGRGPTKWRIPIPEMTAEPETSVNERIRLVQPNSAVEMTALLPQKDAVTYRDESSNVESPIEGKLLTMRNDPTCTEKKLTEPYSAIEMTAPTPKYPDSSIGLENPMQGNSVTVREENQLLARKPTNNGNHNGNEAEEEESTVKRPTKHVHAD